MSTNDNKATAAKWLETAFNNPCDLEKMTEVISKDNPLPVSDNLMSWKFLHTQFSDVKAKIVEQIAEGDKVVTRLDVQGKEGDNRRNWEAIYIHTFNNGLISEGACGSTLPSANVSLVRGLERDQFVAQ